MPFDIETEGLTRRFGSRLAVEELSLQVPAGSVYGFLGRNGAGKTTTLKLLLGLLRADAGSARIRGYDVGRERRAASRQVGALLEAHGFHVHLSGRENLDLTRRLLGLRVSEIDRVLQLTGLSADGSRRVSDYSLGMRQRLGLARALLGAPPVLILDEPSNGLDPEGIVEMRVFLRELPARTGATVLLCSHLLGEIEQTASHVGILRAGRLVVQGALSELKAGMAREVAIGTQAPRRALQVAAAHGFDLRQANDELLLRVAVGDCAERVSAALNRVLCVAGVDVHAVTPRAHSLESLFRDVGGVAEAATAPTPPIAA